MDFRHTFTCPLEYLIWFARDPFTSPGMSHPADGKETQRVPTHSHKVKL